MTRHVRLLPFASLDGPTNMASDEAMLETAAECGLTSLRFYVWTEPTLTLGYFQPSPDREEYPNLASLPWVRRSTGGAGIVHHHELTYSFALPPGAEWRSTESWVCRFHRLLRDVLAEAGVLSRMVVCGEEKKFGEVLCFLHQTPGDLIMLDAGNSDTSPKRERGESCPSLALRACVKPSRVKYVQGSKVAGSAQRKLRGAILQHGSLLLRQSEFAPTLSGMEDLAGRGLFTAHELAELLTMKFGVDASAAIEPGDWSAKERDRVPIIAAEKYGNPEWNAKR